MLVDNLSNGFDVYNITRTSPSLSLAIPTNRRYTKQGTFAENGTLMVCGSDHGKVYIFGFERGEQLQVLHHAGNDALLQMVDAITTKENHFITTAPSTQDSDICIWVKPVSCFFMSVACRRSPAVQTRQPVRNSPRKDPQSAGQFIVNLFVLILALWWACGYCGLWEKWEQVRNAACRTRQLSINVHDIIVQRRSRHTEMAHV